MSSESAAHTTRLRCAESAGRDIPEHDSAADWLATIWVDARRLSSTALRGEITEDARD
jgi:hypothetical protein